MSTTASEPVTFDDVLAARERIAGGIRATPMLRKDQLSARFGHPVFLKGEHLQRTGSFKLRGALNLVGQLGDDERARGVVAASAGNHAQGVAVAARQFGASATIFMPEDASLSKIDATRAYGAQVQLEGDNLAASLVAARAWADARGAVFVHPFDDPRIIAGQGTLGLEIVEQVPDVETVIVPVGGGGLFSGVALAIKHLRPNCRIVAVQARACASLAASLEAGAPVAVHPHPTMADGIAVKQPGELTFELVRRHLDRLVLVDDEHISRAILWLIERAKQVVEGAGATSLAALLSQELELTGPTVCLLSGGNIDSMSLIPVIRHGLNAVGRFMTLSTSIPDRPGELSKLLALLADLKVNVLSVQHHREGMALRLGDTHVELTLQTRNHEHVEAVLDALRGAGYAVRATSGE